MNKSLGATVLALLLGASALSAQTSPLEGRWEGTFGRSRLRLVLDITKTLDGLHFGTVISVDQGGQRIPADRLVLTGDSVHIGFRSVGATFAGVLSAERSQLSGTFMQGSGRGPLVLTRVTAPAALEVAPAPNTVDDLLGIRATLSVPVRPAPFAGAGKQHLVYELHLANHSTAPLLVTRLEILDDKTTLARFEGSELHSIVVQSRENLTDNRLIPAGGWAFLAVWVTLDSAVRAPSVLKHRVSFGPHTLEGTVAVAASNALVLGPPLRGGDWEAANGPDNSTGHHRRALFPSNGRATIAQRFAIDWARRGPNGRLFDGDPRDNKAYFGYGAEVIAVADGVVAAARDGIPENVPGDTTAVPITRETVVGNHVILELGQGRYALYAHLMPNSLQVKAGDRVKRGQLIGRLGNSGNSSGPHLHFHVGDRNAALESEGLPYVIDSWELLRDAGTFEPRHKEIPLYNARVRFPLN